MKRNNRILRQRAAWWLQGKLSWLFVRIMYFLAHVEKKPIIRLDHLDCWKNDVLNTFLHNAITKVFVSISRRRHLIAFAHTMLSECGKHGYVNWSPGCITEKDAFLITAKQVEAWAKAIKEKYGEQCFTKPKKLD